MKLYVFPFAPNGAKVRIYLAEKREGGANIELEEVTVSLIEGEQNTPEFREKSPFGTIPVLELDDGRILHESLAIIDYLEELHPDPPMWGRDPYERAYARQIERLADIWGLMAIARDVHASNSPLGLPPNPVLSEYNRARWGQGLDHFEGLLGDDRPFLAGDHPTVGDCTLSGAFQFARFRELDVLEGRPRLEAWCKRYRERAAADGTIFF